MRFAFAGDRDIAVWVLEFLLAEGYRPEALLLRASRRASHGEQLAGLCSHLSPSRVFHGKRFRDESALATLRELDLDFIVGVHFPYLIPKSVLNIPRKGVLNLHPAYLPFNRGWHTPSWAILEGTAIGATLHLMDEGIDSGPIVAQRELDVQADDTADSLYRRVKLLELDVFKEAWPRLAAGELALTRQDPGEGSSHVKEDLLDPDFRRIDLDSREAAGDLIRKLRAHTTSDPAEAAFFEVDGQRYRVRVEIDRED